MNSYTNKGRQFEVDLVKFLAIPFMISIHFYEQFGAFDYKRELPDSVFRNMMEFIGGPLAAPVFMFSMGIGMVYTSRSTTKDFIRRGIGLLLAGYSLNFVRQTLPQLIGMAMGIDSGMDIIGGLLCVDI
ncbi:MAG: heparan-alpha-glucosaminide N-acetyltransferase domain-containing protein, partial [Lachnospiraceae bacterium]